jgi:hypothetical protein
MTPDVIAEIMEYDFDFLIKIITNKLSPKNFEHCYYVQNQIWWCKRNSVVYEEFDYLSQLFRNDMYETFIKLDWDRLREKERFEYDDINHYEELKELEVRNGFRFNSLKEFEKFYYQYIHIKNWREKERDLFDNKSIEYVIDENLNKNKSLGKEIISFIINKGNEINYIPNRLLNRHLQSKEDTYFFWRIIFKSDFNKKMEWIQSFFGNIDIAFISKESIFSKFKRFLNISNTRIYLSQYLYELRQTNQNFFFYNTDKLKKLVEIDNLFFEDILKISIEKNKNSETKIYLNEYFFGESFELLGSDFKLIKDAYLQQVSFQNSFDYWGKGFLNILKEDDSFLKDYIEIFYDGHKYKEQSGNRNLSKIWGIKNIEDILSDIFDTIIKNSNYYGISDHFCNIFFSNIDIQFEEKTNKFILSYLQKNHLDPNKVNIIINIIHHSKSELFEKAFIQYIYQNQDVECFKKISWIKNQVTFSGDTIVGDVRANNWRKLNELIGKINLGVKLLPIKQYINNNIQAHLGYGNKERERKFLSQKN